jgi:hypothetical protein
MNTTELVELLLNQIPFCDLYAARGVSTQWKNVIAGSLKLQIAMYRTPLLPARSDSPAQSKRSEADDSEMANKRPRNAVGAEYSEQSVIDWLVLTPGPLPLQPFAAENVRHELEAYASRGNAVINPYLYELFLQNKTDHLNFHLKCDFLKFRKCAKAPSKLRASMLLSQPALRIIVVGFELVSKGLRPPKHAAPKVHDDRLSSPEDLVGCPFSWPESRKWAKHWVEEANVLGWKLTWYGTQVVLRGRSELVDSSGVRVGSLLACYERLEKIRNKIGPGAAWKVTMSFTGGMNM